MHLPIYIDMEDKKTAVFGLGNVGRRRAEKLRDSGADVKGFDSEEVELEGVEVEKRTISEKNLPKLKEFFLVVASTDDTELNRAITREAKQSGCIVSCAGDFREGDVVFPGFLDTVGDRISITTMGNNPRLTKKIREVLENEFSKE